VLQLAEKSPRCGADLHPLCCVYAVEANADCEFVAEAIQLIAKTMVSTKRLVRMFVGEGADEAIGAHAIEKQVKKWRGGAFSNKIGKH
jgi:hypothetical protein